MILLESLLALFLLSMCLFTYLAWQAELLKQSQRISAKAIASRMMFQEMSYHLKINGVENTIIGDEGSYVIQFQRDEVITGVTFRSAEGVWEIYLEE
ncbi:MAG: hypothetical protein ACK5MW_01405 [Enterococcus sp.]